jgi:hypothetical protein
MVEPTTFNGGINGVPQFQDRQEMWGSLSVSIGSQAEGALAKFLATLSDVYDNGTVVHRCFEIGLHPVFQWFWSRDQLREMFFLDKFMALPLVRESLGLKSVDYDLNTKFKWESPLLMPGHMAWALDEGGAYERPEMTALEIRDLANAAVDQMIDGRYENALFFRSGAAWDAFFKNAAWDCTWILTQIDERRVHVILATDTD